MQYKISAIVPAYNEEKKVQGVLEALKECDCLDEIICINDGSTDLTLDKIKTVQGIKLINLKKNLGKSYAITDGIQEASGDIVVFIDADLDGLKNRNIKQLINPLISGKYDVVVGYYSYDYIDDWFRPISGERAYFKKDLVHNLHRIRKEGYGLELKLNYLFRNKRIKVVRLVGVRHTLKHKKQSYDTVARLFLRESRDLIAQLFKNDNPLEFFIKAYFSPYYLKRPITVEKKLNKLINAFARMQKEITGI